MIAYPEISLVSVYDHEDCNVRAFVHRTLWYLLEERKSFESISHRKMPSWQDHVRFVEGKPYKEWYLIQRSDGTPVGSIYITHLNEIGIGILLAHRRNHYASSAIFVILSTNPGVEFIANINPENEKSIEMFSKFGFTQIQNTYRRNIISLEASSDFLPVPATQ